MKLVSSRNFTFGEECGKEMISYESSGTREFAITATSIKVKTMEKPTGSSLFAISTPYSSLCTELITHFP